MRLLILCVVFLTGCASISNGPYNSEEPQDPDCYAHYGANPGYCSAFFHARERNK